jgi:UPF0755 protein
MEASKATTGKPERGCSWLGCRFGLAALVAIAAAAVLYATWYRPALRPVDPTARKTQLLRVTKGESSKALCADLQAKGLIRDARAAWLYGAVSGRGRRLQAGYYDVSAAMSARDLLRAIGEGKVARRKVAVVPGLRIEQVAARVERSGLATAADFLKEARTDAYAGEVVMELPPGHSLEGYLFPATYTLAVGTPVHDMALGMVEAFQSKFASAYARDIQATGLGLHKVVTLASMIEREAKVDGERPIIAGVLMNRVRQKMKLQVDATVLYALGHHKTRVTAADLTVNSPYNTYLCAGLPPGPICSPGLASLAAAARPAQHTYLFYVATGHGTHIFTHNYAEHVAAIGRVHGGGR